MMRVYFPDRYFFQIYIECRKGYAKLKCIAFLYVNRKVRDGDFAWSVLKDAASAECSSKFWII